MSLFDSRCGEFGLISTPAGGVFGSIDRGMLGRLFPESVPQESFRLSSAEAQPAGSLCLTIPAWNRAPWISLRSSKS